MRWIFNKKGLITTQDQSTLIGTFHADRDNPRKEFTKALVLNSETMRDLLARFVLMNQPGCSFTEEFRLQTVHEADQVLNDVAEAAMRDS